MTLSITPRANDLLRFVSDYVAKNAGTGPTYDEIAEGIGLKSKSGVHRLVLQLTDRGLIHRKPGCERAIEIVSRRSVSLPADLYGRVAILASQHNETPDQYVAWVLRNCFSPD